MATVRSYAPAASLCVALLVGASGATAAELTLLVTGSMVDPFEAVGEDFTHATGHTLKFSTGTTSAVVAKIRGGERADIVVLAAEAAADLESDGTIVAGTRTPVASSVFGVVVRADRARPEVSTADALKQAVTAARTISYPDPVVATVSGGYIEQVFERLGIKELARAKAALKPMGYLVGEAVQNGEVELGLSFISEFVGNERLAVIPFPPELQKAQLYAAGVLAGNANAALAREFIAFVTSAGAREKLTAAGVVPASASAR
jgi:molybdate transport system substrate-binding protein